MVKDNINSRVTVYRYDENNRLAGVSEYSSDEYESIISTVISYDDKSRIESLDNHISYSYTNSSGNVIKAADTLERTYSYLDDGKLSGYSISGNFTATATYIYDSLDRVSEVVYTNSVNGNNLTISESYTYITDTVYGESGLIQTYTVTVGTSTNTYTYTYNSSGNITKIRTSDGKEIEYLYNPLGQLTSEDNDVTGYYHIYTYDKAGNLTQTFKRRQSDSSGGIILGEIGVGETVSPDLKPNLPSLNVTNTYTYTDSEWGDLLTAFNGTAITYDEIGNPISYYNGSSYTFGWEGRKLISATKGGVDYAYAYNSDGLRISKTKNVGTADEITIHYVYDGDVLVAECSDSETIVYIYDAYDSPIGFKYRSSSYAADTWDVYWYGKNLQGDIASIYSSSGTLLVTYIYNAWGATTKSYSGGGASTTAVKNNLTYRGYYYDSDLGMYYLQSRYYDPAICRFINADNQISTNDITGTNLFAYCGNNPVNRIDPTGESWLHWGLGATIVAACAVATIVTCGGFAAAATAVCLVGNGVAAATVASTVAASAFIGSATIYSALVFLAASTSDSLDEFADEGDWGTVASTALGGLSGGASGYDIAKAQLSSKASFNLEGSKNEDYINKRGWDFSKIDYAIKNGKQGTSINMANNSPCTAYLYPGTTNQYVVIDNDTKSVVQVSNFNDSGWIPDFRIVWDP